MHAPRGRDAEVVRAVLATSGTECQVCVTFDALTDAIREGAAAALVTEESLPPGLHGPLAAWLAAQSSWSDFPFIVLATRQTIRRTDQALESLRMLGNLVLLERPVNAETLARAAVAAVRARHRQYATRAHLQDLADAHATVASLNAGLEGRIAQRTRELAEANDRLMAEIAERERAQQSLVHAQKMEAIGQLTGGMAHDFNNLLHVVSMNLDLLARLVPEPKVAGVTERAQRAVARGAKLTGQLLSFARSQSLLARPTDLNALLVGMRELVAVSVGGSVQLTLDCGTKPAWALLDANQLEMAVLNLAVNAKDAMAGIGALALRVGVVDGASLGLPAVPYARVTVTDDGPGIPAHLLGKVFDPFFTTKPVGSGTGLGLSQVYGFAQQSGGVARIDSAPGEGTTVEMLFPAIPPPPVEEVARPDLRLALASVPRRVAVIEDDDDVRRVIVDSLVMAGHTVHAAPNGEAGLAALQAERPDLLIVDYAMPGMTGAAVIAKVHALYPGLPVILATGYADMDEVARVLGTHAVLVKPFHIDALLRAVDEAMQPSEG